MLPSFEILPGSPVFNINAWLDKILRLYGAFGGQNPWTLLVSFSSLSHHCFVMVPTSACPPSSNGTAVPSKGRCRQGSPYILHPLALQHAGKAAASLFYSTGLPHSLILINSFHPKRGFPFAGWDRLIFLPFRWVFLLLFGHSWHLLHLSSSSERACVCRRRGEPQTFVNILHYLCFSKTSSF